jgi:hypothetical protein
MGAQHCGTKGGKTGNQLVDQPVFAMRVIQVVNDR